MDEEIAEIVGQYGWYVANVSDHDPPFLYTIGLIETYQHPELVIFGLDADNAYALFAGLVSDIQNGSSYADPGVYSIKLGSDEPRVGFRPVDLTQHPVYLGFAMGFARRIGRIGELQAMQVFWPDSTGKFPFDVGCDVGVYSLQPRLDIGLTPQEVKQFERKWD